VSIKEHRIYKYMSEPLRIVGLTLDEIALFMGSLLLFLFVDAILLKLFFIVLGSLGVFLVKKFKKIATGFSLTSYLHWALGFRSGVSRLWPESWKRKWRA